MTLSNQPVQNKNFLQNVTDFWKKGLINKIVLGLAVFFVLCMCCSFVSMLASPSQSAAPTQDAALISTNAVLTAWAPLTQTAAAASPTPSETPLSTNTPEPTATNTPLPQPVVLTGSGDSVVDVNWDGPAAVHIKHTGGGNFAVQSYDANNNYMDLLVNTIGNYEGTVPINFFDDEDVARFQVSAGGSWEITISPLASLKLYDIPTTITGVGDDIVWIKSGSADLIKADNSQGNGNFAIWAYGSNGRNLVFNEIAPYSGTALLDSDTFILVITATNSWSIEITAK